MFRAWSRLVEVRPVRHINRGRDGVRIGLLDQIWRSAFSPRSKPRRLLTGREVPVPKHTFGPGNQPG